MEDPIDQFIVEATTRKPARVWAEGTEYLRKQILPTIRAHTTLPEHLVIYAVKSQRGFAYFKERRITVPAFAFNKGIDDIEKLEYITWYLSHEIAHIANYVEFGSKQDNHGPNFMRHLIRICPIQNALRFEVGYKPRNAKAAGISDININDL